ncbi:MAG: plasmid mobilization protein [Acidimicrobiales bacterium]
MTEEHLGEMTEAELAEHYYSHRDDIDSGGEEEVDYVPPRAARVAIRLSFEEERRIRQAAEAAGMSVSAFLRQVGLRAASGAVVDIDRLRRDVNEARARMDDAWQALG